MAWSRKVLAELMPEDGMTRRLWGNERNEQMRQVMTAMDSINNKFGRDTVRVGLFARSGKWRTRAGKKSPRYTTNWSELMKVK